MQATRNHEGHEGAKSTKGSSPEASEARSSAVGSSPLKKRIAMVGLVLVVLAPAVTFVCVPEARERVRTRWHVHKLRSQDPEIRKAMIGALVAKGPAEIDDIFPEVVAAAVMDVSSRSVFIASREKKAGRAVIALVPYDAHHNEPTDVYVERALTPIPDEVLFSVGNVLFPGPLFRFSQARSLFVTSNDRLAIVVPLEGERGAQILAIVEERLARGR